MVREDKWLQKKKDEVWEDKWLRKEMMWEGVGDVQEHRFCVRMWV